MINMIIIGGLLLTQGDVKTVNFDYTNFGINEKAKIEVYFGKKNENITHFSTHFLLGLWRVDYAIIAAISIETADTLNGKFELSDWTSRLSGCLSAYLFKKIHN